MVRVGRIASSISGSVGRAAGSSASAITQGFKRFSPDASSFKRRVSMSGRRGADTAGGAARRGADTAGDMVEIAGKSKTFRKRLAKLCGENPVKCTAGMALAGYTAVNMAENTLAQQECIAKCLPPNWTSVVESNGEIAPEYFLNDP